MAQCAAAFERLPVIENANLLRNIIYSGVWTRFELCRNKKRIENKKMKVKVKILVKHIN